MRITNDIRQRIVEELNNRAFGGRLKEMKDREHKLALKAYHTVYPPAFEAQCDKLEEAFQALGLGGTFINRAKSISFNPVIGSYLSVTIEMAHARPARSTSAVTIKRDSAIFEELEQFYHDRKALQEEMDARGAEAMAILATAHTLASLKGKWPKVVSIAEKVIATYFGVKPAPAASAIVTTDLDAVFDLPADEKELEAA